MPYQLVSRVSAAQQGGPAGKALDDFALRHGDQRQVHRHRCGERFCMVSVAFVEPQDMVVDIAQVQADFVAGPGSDGIA